jgi:YHS domain-containing protein
MVKVVLYLFLAIILISVLRSVIGLLAKAFGGLLEPSAQAGPSSQPQHVGELKRDPVCGTYVSAATSVKRTVDGRVVHFCSHACSQRYAAKV